MLDGQRHSPAQRMFGHSRQMIPGRFAQQALRRACSILFAIGCLVINDGARSRRKLTRVIWKYDAKKDAPALKRSHLGG
jgi:hypothetical protein